MSSDKPIIVDPFLAIVRVLVVAAGPVTIITILPEVGLAGNVIVKALEVVLQYNAFPLIAVYAEVLIRYEPPNEPTTVKFPLNVASAPFQYALGFPSPSDNTM
jgi:hypothetical protein